MRLNKSQLRKQLNDLKAQMEPFAVHWAKVSQKTFDHLFTTAETPKELRETLDRLKPLVDGPFRRVLEEWKELPESQWVITFAQGMEHLPEYKNLKSALTKFRKEIYNANSTK